jgi:excisionase family DNA binding protein
MLRSMKDRLEPLLTPREVDQLVRWPRGRALRLARSGELPAVYLPGNVIRFRRQDIERLFTPRPANDDGKGGRQ